ncbi:hypothetical protein [Haloferula sp. A504]|uniref:hypothetical protein n=1 Tax=Haloferula sp. A504 TaxID=3373601 RepID=UPI0031C70C4E|nr:hypothetical protein [Verrucomicrobiaceae bacterium E54]
MEEEYRPPVPATSASKTKKSYSPSMVIVATVLLVILGFVTWPMIGRQQAAAQRTTANNHLKQIGLCFLEFDQEFGAFPSEDTANAVKAATETDLNLQGTSTNALFRQFIAYGIQSEEIFWCRHPELPRSRPDNDIDPGEALAPGEVGYSYLAGLKTDLNPGIPLAFAPMKIGTESFHSEVYGGMAVVLHLDNSVWHFPIRPEDGRVASGGGSTLFDPTSEIWPDDYTIDLRHPEK